MNRREYAKRVEKWKPIIADCESSGMSATKYCQVNGYNRDQYQYWKKKVKEFSLDCKGFENCKETKRKGVSSPVLTIQRGDVRLHLYNDADSALIAAIISAIFNPQRLNQDEAPTNAG